MAKSESKPRKNIQYKDIAAAVSKMDNLQFLSDTVPRTVTFKQVKEREQEQKARDADHPRTNGIDAADAATHDDALDPRQRSIAHMMGHNSIRANGTNGAGTTDDQPLSPARQRISLSMATSPIVDRSILPRTNGQSQPHHGSDVDMED